MKVGCHTLQWGMTIDRKSRYTWDGKVREITFPEVLNDIARLGFEGFECTEDEIAAFRSNVSEFRNLVTQNQIQFVSAWSTLLPKKLPPTFRTVIDSSLPMSDPRQYQPISISEIKDQMANAEVIRQMEYAKIVSDLGGEMLTVGGPYIMDKDIRDEHYRIAGGALNQIGDEVAKFGMRIAYHPEVGTLVKNSKEVDMLFDYADKNLVSLCLETAHLTVAGDDPVQFVNKYSTRIIHAHLKDLAKGQFSELGTGEVDFPAIKMALERCGYDKWLMAELDIPSESPFKSAQINKAYLDKLIGKRAH